MTETIIGIEYTKPKVFLLQESGLGVAEFAGRTAYNSFDKSENSIVSELNTALSVDCDLYDEDEMKYLLNNIQSSKLLEQLTWVNFHESVLEHINFSFLLKGTSRGVLQELSRHRIASYTVQSTRYTMSDVINAFVASVTNISEEFSSCEWFITKLLKLDLFITDDTEYNRIEAIAIFSKLLYQMDRVGAKEFYNMSVSKSSLTHLTHKTTNEELFKALQNGKQKRNVGDSFKHIVTDNWKVDLVMTINLRSLKNFLNLRDSGAAYFQMQWLAHEIKKSLPNKYIKLINKGE